jgi:hypothetical protein
MADIMSKVVIGTVPPITKTAPEETREEIDYRPGDALTAIIAHIARRGGKRNRWSSERGVIHGELDDAGVWHYFKG